jgi:hypothetical protein
MAADETRRDANEEVVGNHCLACRCRASIASVSTARNIWERSGGWRAKLCPCLSSIVFARGCLHSLGYCVVPAQAASEVMRPATSSTTASVARVAHQLRIVASHRSAPPAPAPAARNSAVFSRMRDRRLTRSLRSSRPGGNSFLVVYLGSHLASNSHPLNPLPFSVARKASLHDNALCVVVSFLVLL